MQEVDSPFWVWGLHGPKQNVRLGLRELQIWWEDDE